MSGLPMCPYAMPCDDDLTGVVTHLSPSSMRRGRRERDPNEPEVRWLLEAGIRALGETVLDRQTFQPDHPAYTNANGFFDALPMDSVMHAYRDMCREQGIDPGSANKARLVRRWVFAANYQLDLIAYVFRPALHIHTLDEAERAARKALRTCTFGEVVERFAAPRSSYTADDSVHRIQQILLLMFPTDPAIRRYAADMHSIGIARWGEFYSDIAGACGLTARTDSRDIAAMLHLIGHSGVLLSPTLDRPLTTTGGVPLVVATVHAVLESAYGLPWDDIAARRITPPTTVLIASDAVSKPRVVG